MLCKHYCIDEGSLPFRIDYITILMRENTFVAHLWQFPVLGCSTQIKPLYRKYSSRMLLCALEDIALSQNFERLDVLCWSSRRTERNDVGAVNADHIKSDNSCCSAISFCSTEVKIIRSLFIAYENMICKVLQL